MVLISRLMSKFGNVMKKFKQGTHIFSFYIISIIKVFHLWRDCKNINQDYHVNHYNQVQYHAEKIPKDERLRQTKAIDRSVLAWSYIHQSFLSLGLVFTKRH